MISRSTDVSSALRSRQRGFLLNPFRFQSGSDEDPYYANVSCLLHFNGANGSTTIVDNGPLSLSFTTTGTSQISTARSKFGGSSLLCAPGSQVQCTDPTPFQFGGDDFTIESWIYMTGSGGDRSIAALWAGGALSWLAGINSSDQPFFYYSINGTSGSFPFIGYVLPENTWKFISWSRIGTLLYVHVDGVFQQTITVPALFNATTNFTVGAHNLNTATWNGNIDELRITNGVGRYGAANYAVPTSEFPEI